MKKIIIYLVLIVLLAALAVKIALRPETPPDSQAFTNGHVITMSEKEPFAEAVFVRGKMIQAVGSTDEILSMANKKTVIHDLNGKTLTPGFIDAHGHFPGSGLSAVGVDLNSPPIGRITNIDELIKQLKKRADTTAKGDWIFGFGYDDTLLAENRHPLVTELDQAIPDHPVLLMHVSGHMAVVNSQAFAIGDISPTTPNPEGGTIQKDSNGNLTGLLEENAANHLQEMAMDFSVFDFLKMVDSAAIEYASVGVTTAQSGGVSTTMATGLKIASMLNKVPFKLELWPVYNELGEQLLKGETNKERHETNGINLGAIKIIADGSIQGYTGYLTEPYHVPYHGDLEYRGYPRIPKAELKDWITKYHTAGFQLAVHGNGDASIDDIIDAFEYAQSLHPVEDPRLILVHAQMARDDQLVKMKKLGITPTFFSAHTYYWGDRHSNIFMGPERANRMSPAKSAEAIGLKYTVHLDTPVVPMSPLLAVWSTANRISTGGNVIGKDQRVSAHEALKAVTINAAWQIKKEQQIGSIEIGKLADLVVLDSDPLTNTETIKDIKVLATFVEGVKIY